MDLRLARLTSLALAIGAGLFLLVFSFDFPAPSQQHDPGAAALPRIAGVGLVLLGLVEASRRGTSDPMPSGRDAWRVAALLALLGAYAAIFPRIGFIEGATLFSVVALLIGGVRSPWVLTLVPLTVSLGIAYTLIALLETSLPFGPLEMVLFS